MLGLGRQLFRVIVAVGVFSGLNSAFAMSTSGALNVTESGAATYSIPVVVPPGNKGVEPSVALTYSSQGGNGWMGVGWSVAAGSAISRCPKNIRQDGEPGAVTFTSSDRFCLDGQRLILVSGSTYGGNGAEYRTEIESYSKIISYGTSGSGPAYFKVWTRSGDQIEYGNSVSAKVQVPGASTVRVWAMNKVTDPNGNYMDMEYFKDLGEFHLSAVNYGGNYFTGRTHDLSVNLSFESRTDVISLYQGGARMTNRYRVSRITTKASSNTIRRYELSYEQSPATTQSRLTSIRECTGATGISAANCKPPTTFQWQGLPASSVKYQSGPVTDICANGSGSYGSCNNSENRYHTKYPDINGDGKSDMCWRPDSGIRCVLSTGSGWDLNNQIITDICGDGSSAHGVCNDSDNWDTINYSDMNGDGLADLIYRGDQGIQVWLSNGNGFGNRRSTGICANNSTAYGVCNSLGNYLSLRVADVNGDGLGDVCIQGDDGIRCYKASNALGFNFDLQNPIVTTICVHHSQAHGACDNYDNTRTVTYVDVSGDGRADLIYRGDQGVQTWFSTGTGFVLADSSGICANNSTAYGVCNDQDNHNSIRFTDINGDSLPDMCFRADQGIRCIPATGMGWDTDNQIITDICGNNSTSYGVCNDNDNFMTLSFFGDVNGDGRSDLMYRGDQGIQLWFSTGYGFANRQAYTICANGSGSYGICNDNDNYLTITVADINGDAMGDIAYRSDLGLRAFIAEGEIPDLLSGITTGIGHHSQITYRPLTDSSVYQKGTSYTSYPTVSVQMAMYVASELAVESGSGQGNVVTRYRYEDLKTDVLGYGSLGFAQFTELQVNTALQKVTKFRQNFPYVGMPSEMRNEAINQNGIPVVKREETYLHQCVHPVTGLPCTLAPGQRYFPHVQSQTTTSTDLSGWPFPTVNASFVYDDYGNVVETTTTTSDGFTKHVENTYRNDTVNWILGLLTKSVVTTTAP